MRRSLVLTDEAARHPFRASLPPHVTRTEGDLLRPPRWRPSIAEVRSFAAVYVSGVVGITAFIA
ncbi:hypothetical protein ETX26_07000 [Pelagerythrobacter rhizovicinus]|uniref:Uncharacterized protein n=1 Tax=Pelagerythrobacter rhizovicinus TaxID=2268576 RepID=A0A4V1QWK0_9SPHN|nr:hypothetical protein ETX26_07000 [Pelagerythrobacter rhizovicinus]